MQIIWQKNAIFQQKNAIPQKSDTYTQQIIGIIWRYSKSVVIL